MLFIISPFAKMKYFCVFAMNMRKHLLPLTVLSILLIIGTGC